MATPSRPERDPAAELLAAVAATRPLDPALVHDLGATVRRALADAVVAAALLEACDGDEELARRLVERTGDPDAALVAARWLRSQVAAPPNPN